MEYLANLFTGTGLAPILIYLCMTSFMGVFLGKFEVKGIKLGIAGVLFVGIILSHFKASGGSAPLDPNILHFVKEFGLILFIYAIGIDVGPRFVSTFRNDGLKMNSFAFGVVALGVITALGFYVFTDLEPAVITGILCGAVTNTPGLGAAQQALGADADGIAQAGMAYAVAYPFGVLGIILTMILVRWFFRVKIEKEVEDYNNQLGVNTKQKLASVEIGRAHV